MHGQRELRSPRKAWHVLSSSSLLLGLAALLVGCNNSPWELGAESSNTIHSAMIENTPRHLDTTASYWSNDTLVTYQVYEPPYGYHYFKRPFELVPKTASEVVRGAISLPTMSAP